LDGIVPDNFFRQFLAGILGRKVPVSKLIEEFKKYYFSMVNESSLLSEYSLYSDEAPKEVEDELVDKSVKADEKIDAAEENNGEEEENEENIVEDVEVAQKIDIVLFSKSLSEAAEIYSKIVKCRFTNVKINKHLYNLLRIKSLPSYTFLLNLFKREVSDEEKIEALRMLEVFMLRWHICEKRTSLLDDIFPKLVSLPDNNLAHSLKNELLKEMPESGDFYEKLKKYDFKGNTKRAKYLLEAIEYHLIDDQGEYNLNSGKELHLEHIIPQKIKTNKAKREFGDWTEYLGENALLKHKEYVNRIGNLTLLGEKLNIKAKNNPFLNKKREYKKSNIRLTQELMDYGRFDFKTVEKRGKYLAEMAVNIWKIEN
jgi:hypothetical protein